MTKKTDKVTTKYEVKEIIELGYNGLPLTIRTRRLKHTTTRVDEDAGKENTTVSIVPFEEPEVIAVLDYLVGKIEDLRRDQYDTKSKLSRLVYRIRQDKKLKELAEDL